MKYLKIILISFFTGCLLSCVIVLAIQSQRTERIPPHGCDMSGLAYGMAIGFNILLAIGTLPTLFNASLKVRNNIILSIMSFFLLPLIISLYSAIALDATALLFCAPYVLTLSILFILYRRNLKPAVDE